MSERELAALAPPRKLGAYRIVRELGRGGMGVVYEATHELLQRRVAIKLMRPELAANPLHVERFVREGRAACNIRHPHVIDVFEFAFADGAPYLVMDYLEGETLADCVEREGRLSLGALLTALFPVLSAVAAAHAAGVVHRDLKPSNIMLARMPDGRSWPKVLDFGTSKLMAKLELGLTQSAAMIGTPYYMAPEQAQSSRDVDARCDQYALGVILYECATGRRPFEAENQLALLHAIMSAPVVPPSQIEPSLPAAFDSVVSRALQREPSRRFPGVQELAVALLELAPEPLARKWEPEFSGAGPLAVAAMSPVPMASTLVDSPSSQIVELGASSRGLHDEVGSLERRREGARDAQLSPHDANRVSSPESQRGRVVARTAWSVAVIVVLAAGFWFYRAQLQRSSGDTHVVEAPSGQVLGGGPSGRADGVRGDEAARGTTSNAAEASSSSPVTPAASQAEAVERSNVSPPASDARSTPAAAATRASQPARIPRRRPAPGAEHPSRVQLGDNGAPILE